MCLLLGISLSAWAAGCRPRNDAEPAFLLKDAPLQPSQAELLTVAFEAASAMPISPHIKNRSRAQEAVVEACLELDQPRRAKQYIRQIENWRRGAAYADLAFYCVRKGARQADVEPYLKLALESSQQEQAEDWRRDRIKTKVAKTRAYLGQAEQAARLEQGVEASESGRVAHAQAMTCPPEAFDEQMDALATTVASGQFDVVQNALQSYAELYNRFYDDAERRALVLEKIKASWQTMPFNIRINLLMQLADSALAHADQAHALELVNEARDIMNSVQWEPRFEIPLKAALAEMQSRCGDQEDARTEARQALELFDTNTKLILNIERAGMLHPIAEAYHAMGDTTAALEIYRRALEAGVENPNSRPRAEDLAATCCSMAVHAMEPDAQLMKRIGEIRDGLGNPW
jgi:tetratricopeptide (TPR) repeat protein